MNVFFSAFSHVIHPFLGKIACFVAQVIKGYVCNGAILMDQWGGNNNLFDEMYKYDQIPDYF